MSFDFHHNKSEYFRQQYLNSKHYVIPFIAQSMSVKPGMKVIEIGCAEGGVLKAFTDAGCNCTGIELSPSKIDNARIFMAEELASGRIQFVCKNIYDVDFEQEFSHHFDLIILKDTIEHIHDQEKLIGYLKRLLQPGGQIFFGFPPWHMPWGGHQQICNSKFLMYLPYFHLLPVKLYEAILRLYNEPSYKISDLLEIKQTGISTHRFEKIIAKTGFKILKRRFYTINPIYQYKFGWKPRAQWPFISTLPVLRDVVSTTVYYQIGSKEV